MKPHRTRQINRIAVLLVSLAALLSFSYYFKDYPAPHERSTDESIPFSGLVSRVVDGDTIQLSNGEWIRYIGVDAPELRRKVGTQWIEEPQPWAGEAYELNRSLVEGKRVRFEWDVEHRDRYHRLLAYVFVDDLFVNAELVKAGYATVFTFPPNVRYRRIFLDLEEEAKTEHRGLWSARFYKHSSFFDPSAGFRFPERLIHRDDRT